MACIFFTPFFTAVYIVERLVLQTLYVLKKEILQILCQKKNAVYNQKQLIIKRGYNGAHTVDRFSAWFYLIGEGQYYHLSWFVEIFEITCDAILAKAGCLGWIGQYLQFLRMDLICIVGGGYREELQTRCCEQGVVRNKPNHLLRALAGEEQLWFIDCHLPAPTCVLSVTPLYTLLSF